MKSNKNHLEIDLNIESCEETSLVNGENAYIFYLVVDNKTVNSRNINLINITYRTAQREQLELDNWLAGYLSGKGEIKPNSFIKAGLVFYKTKLKSISENDTLYVTLQLPEEGAEIKMCFIIKDAKWQLTQTEIDDIEIRISPKQLEKIQQKKIERVDAFEKRLNLSLEKLAIRLDNEGNGWVKILGELHLVSENEFNENFQLVCVLYDTFGGIIDQKVKFYPPESFYGFDVFEFVFIQDNLANDVGSIKIYPKT